MPSVFRPNRNLAQDLEGESGYVEALAVATEAAKKAAQTIAKAEAYDEGDYHDGIKVLVQGKKVTLSAFDYKSHWIEWGVDRPGMPSEPIAPLRRGVRMVGMKLTETPK